jgi:divalent metal cation (Fe/Co/Zn/Cd) transporter
VSATVVLRSERERLVRRARLLAWGGNAWHLVEFAVAVAAGVASGSIALIGFGIDSLIELLAGSVVVWLLAGGRVDSADAERRAQRLVAVTYLVLAAYLVVEAGRSLLGGEHPGESVVGIVLAAITLPTMPLLARAKRQVGRALGSHATASEGTQNLLCAYLSGVLLVSLGLNALAGWWWADPLGALVIAAVAAREGLAGWRGEQHDHCC